jgi:hypothetical protein
MARKILNVGTDTEHVKLRDKALVSAGYHVVSATNLLEVIKACEQHDIDLAVLGHALSVNEKSRITSTVRSIWVAAVLKFHRQLEVGRPRAAEWQNAMPQSLAGGAQCQSPFVAKLRSHPSRSPPATAEQVKRQSKSKQ